MKNSNIPLFDIDHLIKMDRRLLSSNHIDLATIAYVPQNKEEHQQRKEWVKKRLLLAAGLDPMPSLPEFKPAISSGKVYHGVIIKEVLAETAPGLKLTGNLFLPEKATSPLPGILCPHGHWPRGRVHHAKDGGVVMRCFQLARLGFAVFAYDMIGYNDNNDFPHQWDLELRRKGDLEGISTFGMQTLNSMRAVDLLASLPEVDPEKIGCTGASGGGSQTWFIAALDERIKIAAPVCMLSSHFQGGCSCEEGPLLRVDGLTSFDIVASLAPRPLFLPSVTGDWTNLNPVYEIPNLKKVYALYGAEDAVSNVCFDDGHNYNQRTREHVYPWFLKHFCGIDRGKTIPEEDIAPPPPELLWHGGTEPLPATPESIESAFAELLDFHSSNVLPATPESLPAWQISRKELLKRLLATTQLPAKNVAEQVDRTLDVPGGKARVLLLSRRGVGDRVISVQITPEQQAAGNEILLLAADGDCREYFGSNAKAAMINSLIAAGKNIRLIELTGSGMFAGQLEYALRNPDNTASAFDESFFSMRVQDIITAAVRLQECGFEKIRIAAEKSAVLPALAAAAITGLPVTVDLENVDDRLWEEKLNYQPLIGKIGKLAGLLYLNLRPECRFVHPGKFQSIVNNNNSKYTSFADAL